MLLRQQLPVASPLSAPALIGATRDTILSRDRRPGVAASIADEFGARTVLLTDSGTSALVLALRALVAPGRTIAMPAYACVDLVAAARRAGVRVALYDVDPGTLSADIASLRRVLAEGVDAVVAAHLYGYPADMPAIVAAARESAVPVIEDAAQHACATINGTRVGSMGDFAVLSFGRGKGTTSGAGGAVLTYTEPATASLLAQPRVAGEHDAGYRDVIAAAASWTLGRPSIYTLPASIPALHLGETVYHEAHEPRSMSRAAAALLSRTLPGMHDSAVTRRRNAAVLSSACGQSRRIRAITPPTGAEPGYLRFPVMLEDDVHPMVELGITRGYPRPLSQEPAILPILQTSAERLDGAAELARHLVTLPTHHMVTDADLAQLVAWLRAS